MGPSATATGSSQVAYLARPVGSDSSVVEKMTGITPVAFTCTAPGWSQTPQLQQLQRSLSS